jgi:hypothetical protein
MEMYRVGVSILCLVNIYCIRFCCVHFWRSGGLITSSPGCIHVSSRDINKRDWLPPARSLGAPSSRSSSRARFHAREAIIHTRCLKGPDITLLTTGPHTVYLAKIQERALSEAPASRAAQPQLTRPINCHDNENIRSALRRPERLESKQRTEKARAVHQLCGKKQYRLFFAYGEAY